MNWELKKKIINILINTKKRNIANKNSKINLKIPHSKYIHIMLNDKFNKPFVDFLNKNFNQEEHLVLCKRCCKEHPFPKGKNVIEIKSLEGLKFDNAEKVICHSLFDTELADYLYEHQDILKEKAYWVIWGGDLYNAPRDKKNDFVRSNFKGYITDVDNDSRVAKEKYKSNPVIFNAGYTFPITKEMIHNTTRKYHDYINIQINNSCDDSTLEMLDILSKFKDKNIKVTTILSYGKMLYKDKIIKKGKEIFKDKFEYLDKYISPQEYAGYVRQNDILILNQNRQQGLGNCFANLLCGNKVYIKSNITTYDHFVSKGIKIFDTNEIKNINYCDLIDYDKKEKENNMQKAQIFFDDNYLKELWQKVFVY